MRAKIATFILLLACISAKAQTQIAIQNPSFEQLPSASLTTGSCFDSYVARSGYPAEMPPGWVRTFRDPVWGSTSVIRPFPQNSCGVPVAPDGLWILYVASSTVVQDTGIEPSSVQTPGVSANDGLFMMQFSVANYDAVYPGYYEVRVLFGTHELCSADGWATQHFKQISVPCLSPNYLLGEWPDGSAVDPNAHIIISLSHSQGWPLLFDNVSLTFTPTN